MTQNNHLTIKTASNPIIHIITCSPQSYRNSQQYSNSIFNLNQTYLKRHTNSKYIPKKCLKNLTCSSTPMYFHVPMKSMKR